MASRRIGEEHQYLVLEPNKIPRKKKSEPSYSVLEPGPQWKRTVRAQEEEPPQPVWKTYLYHLQMKAPKPVMVTCQHEIYDKPPFYGREFHGAISREEADRLLNADGCYLVRESQRAPGAYTLAIRFEGQKKNFKLYFDGQHFVGEKRFDNIHDLVEDGLITFYLESKAADYIAALSNESNYAESPYMAYTSVKHRQLNSRQTTKDSMRDIKRIAQQNYIKEHKEQVDVPTLSAGDQADASLKHDGMQVSEWMDVMQYEKAHNFKVHNFKGPHWCDFCANFMWGLIAQGVKCQDCGFQAHKKCSTKVPNDCMPEMKHLKRMFGVDLTTLVKAQQTSKPVPIVVEKCVREIENRGLSEEGLYRVAGFHDDIEAIKMAFDKDGDMADISVNKYEDINTIASVMKLFLRLLPIPLVTFEVYPACIQAVTMENLSPSEQLSILKKAVNELPPAHYQTLKYLLLHLQKVNENCAKNMMSVDNLSIVFAPTILRSDDADPMKGLVAVKFERMVMELFIKNVSVLFER